MTYAKLNWNSFMGMKNKNKKNPEKNKYKSDEMFT